MNVRCVLLTAVLLLMVNVSLAQSTWDGGAGTFDLNTANNWNPNGVPASGSTVTWDGTQAGNLNLTFAAAFGPTAGYKINIAATQTGNIQIVNNHATTEQNFRIAEGTTTFGMATGSGAFALGGTGQKIQIVLGASTTAEKSYALTNNSANAATFGSNVRWSTGSGAKANMTFAGSGDFNVLGTLFQTGNSSSNSTITKIGGGMLTLGGTNNSSGAIAVSGGTLRITDAKALGNPDVGTTITGGSSSTSMLEVMGGISVGEALSIGSKNNSSVTLRNVSGDNTLAGTITLGSGGTEYNIESASGLLTINGNLTTPSTAARFLNISGAGNVVLDGNISDNGSGTIGLVKSGAGTLTLNGIAYGFSGNISVESGTLRFLSGASVSGIDYLQTASGAVTDLGGNAWNSFANGDIRLGQAGAAVTNVSGDIIRPNTTGTIAADVYRTTPGGTFEWSSAAALDMKKGNALNNFDRIVLNVNAANNVTFNLAGNWITPYDVVVTNSGGTGGVIIQETATSLVDGGDGEGVNTAVVTGELNLHTNVSFNLNANRTVKWRGDVSGSGGLSLGNNASCTLLLSGTNSYAGGTTVGLGTLRLENGRALPDIGVVTLNGGTLDSQGSTETAGPLALAASSKLNLGSGLGTLAFADSSGQSWTGTLTLTGTVVDAQSLRFGTTNTGLTASQLAAVQLASGDGVILSSSGYVLTQWRIASATNALTANHAIDDRLRIVLDSGTLNLAGFSDTVARLQVSGNSGIDLSSGGSIAFSDSSTLNWGYGVLFINGALGATSVRFGTNDTALTMIQQSLLRVNGQKARLDAAGYVKVLTERTNQFQVVAYSRLKDQWNSRPIVTNMNYYAPVTELIFGFARIDATTGAVTNDPPYFADKLAHAMAAKKAQEGMRVTVSVGALPDACGPIITNAALRAVFVENIRCYCLSNGFDGVDYDFEHWEYPEYLTIRQNFHLLVEDTRAAFLPYGLSVTIASSQWQFGYADSYAVADCINDMAYKGLSYSYQSLLRFEKERGLPRSKQATGIIFGDKRDEALGEPWGWAYQDIILSTNVVGRPLKPWAVYYQDDRHTGTNIWFTNLDFAKMYTKQLMDIGARGIMIWDLYIDYWQGTHAAYPTNRNLSLLNAIGEAVAEWVPPYTQTQNAGFDVDLESWDIRTNSLINAQISVSLDTNAVMTGPFSAKINVAQGGTLDREVRFSQIFEARTGTTYRLRFKIKSESGSGTIPVKVLPYNSYTDQYGNAVKTDSCGYSSAATNVTLTFTTTTNRPYRFLFDLGLLPTGTVLYLDDAQVEEPLWIVAATNTLNADHQIHDQRPVILNSGTLELAGRTDTMGALTVSGTASSTLDLSSGGTVAFADSSEEAWTGTLAITGTLQPGSIRFGTDRNGLTPAQLAKILYNGKGVALDANGYLIAFSKGTYIRFLATL